MNNNNKFLSRWLGRCLLIIVSLCVMNDSVAARRNKNGTQVSSRELLLKIKERDAVIADLLLRVQTLENNKNGAVTQQKSLVYDRQSAPPQPAGAGAQNANAGSQTKTPTAETEAPEPIKVDEEASQRALERTLAKTGVLLLPTGYLDSDLNFSYSRWESKAFTAQSDSIDTVTENFRQNIFTPSLSFRLGLPFDSQLEFGLPYQFINQSINVPSLGTELETNGSGLGDVQIGLAKTLLQEEQWWPDLIARVTWNNGSGRRNEGDITLGGGVDSITGQFSALKRQDPLAFFLAVDYTKSFTEKDYFSGANGLTSSYKPGDSVGISFGTQLAASADTSLSFSLDQYFTSNYQLDSQTIAGSHRNSSTLSIGASSIISSNFFINLSAGMGLTSDSPAYTTGITLSTRNDLKPLLGLD